MTDAQTDVIQSTKSTQKPHKRYSDAEICAALKASGGMVYIAARSLDIDPSTIYKRSHKSKRIASTIAHEREYVLDLAETALKAGVIDREPWAVQFILKTKGRDRGYVERMEVRDWRDRVIDLLRENKITPADILAELGHELATEILDRAGLPRLASGEAGAEGGTADISDTA